jgi:hypothetical protein
MQFWTKFTPRSSPSSGVKNNKIMAIEPMNRKAVRPFRATKAQRSEQTEKKQLRSSHVDFGQCPVANFPLFACQKRFFL